MKLRENINRNIFSTSSEPVGNSKKKFSPHDKLSKINSLNYIHSKSLNDKSIDTSFKGFFLNANKLFKAAENTFVYKRAIEEYGSKFGKSPREFLENEIRLFMHEPVAGVEVVGDSVKFTEKSAIRNLVDIALYPVVRMPADLINYSIKLAKKIPLFKDSKILNRILEFKYLKNAETKAKEEVRVASLKGYLEEFTKYEKGGKLNRIFKDGHGRLDPLKADYSSVLERSLTRFDTGLVAAFFLGNDAYNLSRVIDDNPETAKAEKKSRFKQEVGRVALTSYLSLVTLGAFQKWINNSAVAAAGLVLGSAAVSELFGRIFAGKPVLPVSSEQAKKLAEKENPKKVEKELLRPDYYPLTFNNNAQFKNVFASFMSNNIPQNSNISFKGHTEEKKQKTSIFSLKNVLYSLAGLTALGYGVKFIHGTTPYKAIEKSIQGLYDKIATKEIPIPRADFEKIVKKLEDSGFDVLASSYRKAVEGQTGDILLGKSDRKYAKQIVDTVHYPFKFIYNTLMTPHNLVNKLVKLFKSKDIVSVFTEVAENQVKNLEFNAPAEEVKTTITKAIAEKSNEISQTLPDDKLKKLVDSIEKKREEDKQLLLRRSLQFIQKNVDHSNIEFADKLNKQIFSSMDNTSKSSYSNADLSVLCKLACSLMTSAFLIADNYNMVMVKTKGQDKDLALSKARERTVQRTTEVFFSTYMVKLFNDLFKSIYNKSLLATVFINTTNSALYSSMTRKSVGLPVKEASRKEIFEIEQRNINRKGLGGKYFRFMSWLTGKKRISERVNKQPEVKVTSKS